MSKEFLETAIEAAQEASKILLHFWGGLTHIDSKSHSIDLVTEADRASEKCIFEFLQAHFPDHSFLGEETGHHQNPRSDYLWVVDPIDGTTNYTHQYPMVSISIALWAKAEPLIGVVFNPILRELFTARRGGGATLNGRSIKVSQISSLDRALLATGFPYDRRHNPDNNYAEFCHLTQHSQGVRRGGSAALDFAYVACGRLDAFWERGLKPWDLAAGVLLVQEAGGQISSYQDETLDLWNETVIASNGIIHESLKKELHRARQHPYIIKM